MQFVASLNTLSLKHGDVVITINKDHPNFDALKTACYNADEPSVEAIVNDYKRYISFSNDIFYRHGILYVNLHGTVVSIDPALTSRIIAMSDSGENINAMLMFIKNIVSNPNYDAQRDIYRFLDHNKLPITEDGCFLAWKVVRKDLFDKHSGTNKHDVGAEISMDRAECEHNRDVTCSRGLHFCSKEYLPTFKNDGDRIVCLKINPIDVVSIPTDYNNAKGRCCKYTVIDILPSGQEEEHIEEAEKSVVYKIGDWVKNTVLGWVGRK